MLLARRARTFLSLLGGLFLTCVVTVGSEAGTTSEPYELGGKHFWLIVKRDDTPMYAAPSEDSRIVEHWWKGREFSSRKVLGPAAIDRHGTNSTQWIKIKGYGEAYPDGWLRRRDLLSPAEFKRVERWPIKTLFRPFGDAYSIYRFEPDGRAREFVSSESKLGYQDAGHVMVADRIVYIGQTENEGPLGLFFNEKQGLLCPGDYEDCAAHLATPAGSMWRQTKFTQEEMDAFFRARAEGRPPPPIDYGP